MPDITEKLRHWSYNRQRLGKQGTDLIQVLKDIIGVYSAHPSGPLSLYARVKDFNEDDFYALDEEKLAFRLPSMRLSAYMLPIDTAHYVFQATIPAATDPYWEKRYALIPPEHYKGWREKILKLATKPMTAARIKELTGIPDETVKLVINRMAFEGDMLRVGANSLRSNIISYVATKAWAKVRFVHLDADEAQAWLAGKYLRVFGPVRIKDFQWWAGITAAEAKAAINEHKTIDIGGGYLLLDNDKKDFDKFKIPTKDSLDILPQWDSYTMGYAPDGRARFVTADKQHHIYGALGATQGNALGTILVNGLAHGSWSSRFIGSQMHITLDMFEKPTKQITASINSNFDDIAALLKAKTWVYDKEGKG